MGHELIRGVVGVGAACLIPLALGGFLVAGAEGGLGVAAGGALALGNLWLLARGSERALRLFTGRPLHPLWVLGLGLRYLALFGALGLLLWSGRVHPLALIVGLSVLPPLLVACAVRSLRGVA
jgi:hypothetical protein